MGAARRDALTLRAGFRNTTALAVTPNEGASRRQQGGCFPVWHRSEDREHRSSSWTTYGLRVNIRLGRLVLRSWSPFVMWLPAGYCEPVNTFLVEHVDEQSGEPAFQIGAFFNERDAEACMAQLKGEGWTNLHVNIVPVHHRVSDWHWDR